MLLVTGCHAFRQNVFTSGCSQVFAEGTTDYAGQAVGVIVADTHMNAISAAKRVKINYSKTERPMNDVGEVIQKKLSGRINEFASVTPTKKKS